METTHAGKRQTEHEAVFDWRFAELRRAGLPPHAAWLLASDRTVEVRLAERIFAEGCSVQVLLEILL